MNVVANLLVVRRMLARKATIKGPNLNREDDLPWVRVTAAEPIACQVDGDFLGMRDEMVFTAVPAALAVVAPPRNNQIELRK
jgi:diacylglycerol kinase family enzyme